MIGKTHLDKPDDMFDRLILGQSLCFQGNYGKSIRMLKLII